MKCCVWPSVVVLLALGSVCIAQAPVQATANPVIAQEATTSNDSLSLGDDPVDKGDLISVSVYGLPELPKTYRVSADGSISFPYPRRTINVAGKTPDEISQIVTRMLVDSKALVNPIVSVAVLDYRSKRISLVGSFHVPTVVQAIGDFHLTDAIARAQGIELSTAGNDLIVVRKDQNGAVETLHIDVHALMSGSNPALNIALHGGEEIRLPEIGKVYVLGNVKMPGVYSLSNAGPTTIMQAVAMSQGTQYFSKRMAFIFRDNGTGKRVPIEVPLEKIMHRKASDVLLASNDVVYVPENNVTHISSLVLDRFVNFSSGFMQSTMSGLIVFH